MRRLAVFLLAVPLLAGCLGPAPVATPEDVEPLSTLDPSLRLGVHRSGEAVADLPEAVLGGVPVFAQRDLGTRGGEPTLGITSSGAVFVESGDFAMRSRDGGVTWEAAYEHGGAVRKAAGVDLVSNSDPYLWVDPVTDRVFMPTMWPVLLCSQAIWSDDEGETWFDKPMSCGLPGVDHQKVSTGPYVAGSPLRPAPGVDYPNVVYYCYSKVVSSHCAVSVDGGLTYPYDTLVDAQVCPGPHGVPAAAPDGTVYLPLGGLGGCNRVAIGVSEDNGLTWEVRTPYQGDLGQTEIDPDITVTPDGTAYYAFRAGKDNVVHVLRSKDGFRTVEGPFRVAPPDVTSTNFVALTSGDDGRIAVAYLGTRDTDAFANDAPADARWHVFVSTSFDADGEAPTFVTAQVTPPEDPVQIGRLHYGGGGDPARNHLDFIDAHRGPDGRVWVAFTDGCIEECADNPDAKDTDSRARMTAVAVQTHGPSLLAQNGILDETYSVE